MRQPLILRGEASLVLDGVEFAIGSRAILATVDFVDCHTSKMPLQQWLQQATSVIAGIAGRLGLPFRGSYSAANPL